MIRYLITVTLLLCIVGLSAQDTRLASQYYNSGEYEKAAAVYKKLYDKQPTSHYYFEQYVQSLLAMEDYGNAEKVIKDELKKKPDHVQLYVTYGNLMERQYLPEEAEAKYRKAIEEMPNNISIISNLGNSFTRLTKYDLAIETYDKAEKITGNDKIFINNLADLYKRKGNIPKMIEYYIKAAALNPTQVERYKTTFQRYLTSKDDLEIMREQLYEKIQADAESNVYPELLEWVFIEKEDYNSALRQARALDRKNEEDGTRVMNIASIAGGSYDYDTALKAYNYITTKKGTTNAHYVTAKAEALKTLRKKITRNLDHQQADLDTLEQEYESFIAEMGINSRTEHMVKDFADFLAIYKNDLPKAINILDELIQLTSINKYVRANSKISLADYYLMRGEIWESTLLYSQVEKDFKEEHLGEVSRYRNAMLAYYAGEFQWAQEQFDILESATSRLISNDAIDMSVFIMDNMGLDTTDVPLKMFAESELLTLQNKYDAAFNKLDSISATYPEHSLEDDILFQKAELHARLRDYANAKDLYTTVYTKYNEEIRADNALYKLAMLYENQLDDQEKAMELYEKLFVDFSNSTFAIDARKRFRILRGDDI